MNTTCAIPSNKSLVLSGRATSVRKLNFLQRIGLPHHEFWPWWLLVAPVWPVWLWYGIRLRRATWFTAVNPGIEDSGFMGESKMKILDKIPDNVKPITFFVPVGNTAPGFNQLAKLFGDNMFPLIAKPDIGGRGRKLKILENENDLATYHATIAEDYMLQEMIHAPLELGVFYARFPNQEKGQIISLASKGFLKVMGDGTSTISDLMKKSKRAQLQMQRLGQELDLTVVPQNGEEVLLEPIGNHCKGTEFINEELRITDKLNEVFDAITNKIAGVYYGRFDIRVPSWHDLENGNNISILELNGLTSDATHIFDPNYRLRDVFRTQLKHIKISAEIAKHNLAQGVQTTSVRELIKKSWEALKMM